MGKIHDALEKSKTAGPRVVPMEQRAPTPPPTPSSSENAASRPALKPPVQRHQNIDKNLVTLVKPQSIEAEMFKILRSNILFPISGEPPRSILVTSALPGEGKSFISSNLAVSIAQNINEHVLLMDCDVRKANIHRIFGFDDVPGLREHLTRKIPLSSLLLKTSIEKLTILPSGEPPHNPSELLSSKEMMHLIEEVAQRYEDRYVIIDSPPPHLTAETSALARAVDAIVLVVGHARTPRGLVEEVVETLGKDKIIGIVLNRFDMQASRYYGYSKYGKYGKYGRYFEE